MCAPRAIGWSPTHTATEHARAGNLERALAAERAINDQLRAEIARLSTLHTRAAARPDDFIWLPTDGGPLNGERIAWPAGATGRPTPERGHVIELTDADGETAAVYMWDPVRELFACRFDREAER